ncbi:transcriptional regulator, XRE family with shikimate kinase activity [Ruegeria halocynthiae]|uniref:Shikimate kinase n=1 Tax=Ruegeria halocynthiae TaxID=985054 RepID=A0A1H3B4Q3_9RHOB|nr:helix-turn-helix transcriptional regulator [Ruegeria halocynthiae]SDX36927.1 transcriptional regulator, XRE family with shikimate kinase activity [Ruegeria halocynthiae]
MDGPKPPNPAQSEDAGSQNLSALVGARVRRARQIRGIPRRVLSESSGVSPRYLAQLEAGAGNISIGVLQRIARALDYKAEWLIGEDDPWDSDAWQMQELFRKASDDVRESVIQVLRPRPDDDARAQRVCLIGLRGAGKSTLGAMLGASLGLPFVELTARIEEMAGMPLSEVMAFYGQEGYRNLEAQALDRVITEHDRMVLAVAGGIVSEPSTYTTLLSRFHTVWLRTSPTEHMERVRAQGDERPMAGNPRAMEQLKCILASREALYGRANAQMDTSGRTPEASLKDLRNLVDEHGFLTK